MSAAGSLDPGAARPRGAPAFSALCSDPLVRALVAACGATECHLVGGVLRDHALGLATHDVDAVVAGRGAEIAGALAAGLPARLVLLGGKDFAAYRLVILAAGQRVLDLWDRGSMPLYDDLARRDFTVNSFALAPSGEVIDPFGGVTDLERRRLRATTEQSFAGDPLRVLRLARLLTRLPGFEAEPHTVELARRSARQVPEVAAERIRDELWLLFSHSDAAPGAAAAGAGLRLLAALDLYPGLWVGATGVAGGPDGAAAAEQAAAEIGALPGCAADLAELMFASRAAEVATPAIDFAAARFAATFRHVPLAAGEPTAASATSALDRMREAGYLSARQAAEILPLLAEPAVLPATDLERRRFLGRHGRRWPTVACAYGGAAATAGPAARERWRRDARALCELARREGADLIDPPRLLDGDDVQRLLGIAAGPRVGAALAALAAARVDGLVRSRTEAERFLEDWSRNLLSAGSGGSGSPA